MKRSVFTKLLSCVLSAIMVFTTFAVTVSAAKVNAGKYIKDVFIAYGEDKAKAEEWLRQNGWEPKFDLNDGKTSKAAGFHNAVAVLGIKRTYDPKEAITDMATMFMNGGYSFDDYEGLVKEKKADIDEFINTFVPALEEYRDNYNGKGSAGGKKRAQMAHDILNKFFDGDPNGEYAVNDTGKPLGDLLLNKTKTEIGDEAYNALSAEKKLNTADLQQIILESTGPAVLLLEQTLALATDTSSDSWLQRVDGLSGDALVERIAEFAPEVAGQTLAPSAALTLLAAHFEDYSKILASEWIDVHEDILWYEDYCTENGLWQEDDEDDEAYAARVAKFVEELPAESNGDAVRFANVGAYYNRLFEVSYPGEWGDTLFEFFVPMDEKADYSKKYSYFAPIAASLSAGQRAALEFISLPTLIRLGLDSDSVAESDFPKASEIFRDSDGKELKSISIYSGINRAIFRKGVALTSDTLMQKAMGNDPYEDLWDERGMIDIIAYSTFGVGTIAMITGAVMSIVSVRSINATVSAINNSMIYKAGDITKETIFKTAYTEFWEGGSDLQKAFDNAATKINKLSKMSSAGSWMMGIGGALMIIAAILKGVQIYEYYHRTFTQIPNMIVDEADIVSYTTNDEGKEVKIITFDQFAYYEVVKCNRQVIGIHTNAQDGVKDYKEWGCGDAADINADVGKQWLALYVNRSEAKGSPILADSLQLRTGKEEIEKAKAQHKSTENAAAEAAKMPAGCNGCLHMFMEENPVMIDNEAYSYRSDNEGMYLYWKGDTAAFTASTFGTGGTIAVSAVGGLIVGIAGATAVLLPKKKKEQEPSPAEA